MDHTTLGLTRLAPGESPWADGGSFFGRNIDILNHYLRAIAAHHHDAHAALANPTTVPTVASAATGGGLPADVQFFVGYTLVDADGGETALAPIANAITPAARTPPVPFTGAPAYTTGTLPAGTYYYALTATDGAGGESPPSDPVLVMLEPGHANGKVTLSGLTAATSGAPGWRLYRSVNGGDYGFLAAGATDTFVDDCSHCADPQLPPPDATANATSSTAKITVTLPTPLPAGATAARIYAGLDESFPSPSLVAEVAAADAGTPVAITSLLLLNGQPPLVSTTLPGAPKIKLADLASEVTAAMGGGAALALGDSVVWTDPADTTGTASAVRLTARSEPIDVTLESNNFHADDFNPAPAIFDIGQPPNDFGGVPSYLTPKAATAQTEFHNSTGGGAYLIGEGWVEGTFLINTAAAGWDTLGVGWGGSRANPKVGVFAILNRAAGQLQIVSGNGAANPYAVLASAAYSGLADGNVVHVRLARAATNPASSGFDYHASLTIGKSTVAVVDYSTNVLNDSYAQFVTGWTTPAAFGVDSVVMQRTGTRRKLVASVAVKGGYTSEERLLLDDAGHAWPTDLTDYYTPVAQSAAAIAAAGTVTQGAASVTKTGVGTYDVLFAKPLSSASYVIITDPSGGTITNRSATGFTITFGADTAFRFIATVAQ